jgi:hypothetical protein
MMERFQMLRLMVVEKKWEIVVVVVMMIADHQWIQ